MQGGRTNIGRKTTPMSGMQATRMHNPPQPVPIVHRPVAANANDPPRSGTREVARVDGAGLIEAGKVTGTPAQPVQQRLPTSPNTTGNV
jgi:hypothetical protein